MLNGLTVAVETNEEHSKILNTFTGSSIWKLTAQSDGCSRRRSRLCIQLVSTETIVEIGRHSWVNCTVYDNIVCIGTLSVRRTRSSPSWKKSWCWITCQTEGQRCRLWWCGRCTTRSKTNGGRYLQTTQVLSCASRLKLYIFVYLR